MHIGEDRAAEIIAMRPIDSVEQLAQVSGIGAERLAEIQAEGIACVG